MQSEKVSVVSMTPELEFTVVCWQILVWIYVNAIHSRAFILDLPELEFTVVCLQILVWIYVNAIHSRCQDLLF
jgi:hypothetical protein